jgi:uncharacterized membrane protein
VVEIPVVFLPAFYYIQPGFPIKQLPLLRETLFKSRQHPSSGFRLRGQDIKRIETFSDGVFAFAVTLLIVSLEVPKSFEELLITMRGFLAFAICFALLMMVWHEQHVYFRRYALDDRISIILNAMLIFLVLFYVYPLKFLFSLLFSDQIYGRGKNPFFITQEQAPVLMIIYGLGYIVIYVLFLLMYLHALRNKAILELSAVEIFDTRTKLFAHSILISIGLCSVLLAMILPGRMAGLSGMCYMAIGPVFWFYFSKRARRRHALEARADPG